MSPPESWLAVDRAADREASLLLAFNFFEHMMGPTVCKPGVCLPAAGSRCGGDASFKLKLKLNIQVPNQIQVTTAGHPHTPLDIPTRRSRDLLRGNAQLLGRDLRCDRADSDRDGHIAQ